MHDALIEMNEHISDLDDLLEEIGSKNHVTVVKYAHDKMRGRDTYKPVFEEMNAGISTIPGMAFIDRARMLAGRKPIYLPEAFRRVGGDLRSVTANLRTNDGINYVSGSLFGTDTGYTYSINFPYIGLSNNTAATAVTDRSSTVPWSSAQAADAAASGTTGEWTALGLARAVATMAHTANATTLTAAYTWTATGTSTATQKAGLFGGSTRTAQSAAAPTTNILVLENTFTATSLVTNDQLSLTWTITI